MSSKTMLKYRRLSTIRYKAALKLKKRLFWTGEEVWKTGSKKDWMQYRTSSWKSTSLSPTSRSAIISEMLMKKLINAHTSRFNSWLTSFFQKRMTLNLLSTLSPPTSRRYLPNRSYHCLPLSLSPCQLNWGSERMTLYSHNYMPDWWISLLDQAVLWWVIRSKSEPRQIGSQGTLHRKWLNIGKRYWFITSKLE